ncbi:MAG: ferrous iron transporter B [Coriobacteriales bacterium]|nr:ferrous iron transporter B [Coriobacteriales bacterium]
MAETKFTIALAGNPNSGKTTLFNALTGSNQYVGNWPSVTEEEKHGKLKGHSDVTIADLPGIYSLSPYTLEEVVAREYLIQQRPDAIINIVDGTNLERNLYLTTQLVEMGIPVLVAVNMMDIVKKSGDEINISALKKALDCEVMEISALKGTGVREAAEKAVELAKSGKKPIPQHRFAGSVEHALAHIEEVAVHGLPEEQQRWHAIKLFERDERVAKQLKLTDEQLSHIDGDIQKCEDELDDDAESIITAQRYEYITSIIDDCIKHAKREALSISDKIDRVLTNRIAALPIFIIIMFVVYWIAMGPLGSFITDWMNDVFGGRTVLQGIQFR